MLYEMCQEVELYGLNQETGGLSLGPTKPQKNCRSRRNALKLAITVPHRIGLLACQMSL